MDTEICSNPVRIGEISIVEKSSPPRIVSVREEERGFSDVGACVIGAHPSVTEREGGVGCEHAGCY